MAQNKILFTLLLLCINYIGYSQLIPIELKKWLSEEEVDKIHKSQELVEQGKSILFNIYGDDALYLKKSYSDLSIDFEIDKKNGRLLLETKDYFYAGYKEQVKIYKAYIDYFLRKNEDEAPQNVKANNDSISKMLNEVDELIRKSSAKGSVKAAGELVHLSNLKMYDAIIMSQLTMLDIQNITFSQKEPVVQVLSQVDSENQKSNTAPKKELNVEKNIQAETNINIKEAEGSIETKKESEIYFTIQFVADRNPVSNNRLRAIYKGELPIILNQGSGWYRYSFGKFTDYAEAKKVYLQSKVTGYIVAYNKSERISITKAKELLGK